MIQHRLLHTLVPSHIVEYGVLSLCEARPFSINDAAIGKILVVSQEQASVAIRRCCCGNVQDSIGEYRCHSQSFFEPVHHILLVDAKSVDPKVLDTQTLSIEYGVLEGLREVMPWYPL